jgi:hypothetical protein
MLARALNVAPVRRDLIAAKRGDAFGDTVYSQALTARGWLDPNPEYTHTILQEMVESVTSGRSKINEAVEYASHTIQNAF